MKFIASFWRLLVATVEITAATLLMISFWVMVLIEPGIGMMNSFQGILAIITGLATFEFTLRGLRRLKLYRKKYLED